ncbi:hypothetical protein PV379_02035 [Streptomyces caniscabiei]|uniref:hypothetical protein n=1 Tax=Streptomyces caniscabiei TaxID=2746961 RepID=UPI00299FF36E|nr:hypothetical protein [Streptomyces caniscabiei]MDX2776133.1 hypothetical protein [Streptomyces caniscabiei]
MRTRRSLIAALTATLTLSMAACDKADKAGEPDPNSTTSYYDGSSSEPTGDMGEGDPVPSASTQTLDYVKTDKVSGFSVRRPDGTAYDVTVSMGTLRRAQSGLAVGDHLSYERAMNTIGEVDILGQGCGDVDLSVNSRDAVIPIRVQMTDTTPDGWETEPNIQPTVYVGDEILDPRHDVVIEQSAHLDEGYACDDAGRASVDAGLVGIRMKTSRSDTPGWLILKDYYSPAHPSGDATGFEDVRLVFGTMDATMPNGWNVFSDATGAFSVLRERDSIANDGSYYTSGVAMSLKSVW